MIKVDPASPLRFELLPSGREVKLIEAYAVILLSIKIAVYAGFVTDFASVPRILWMIIPPWGRYSPAAVIHDFLYLCGEINGQRITRAFADWIFLTFMISLGVPKWKAYCMYFGVRLGGWIYWNKMHKTDKDISLRP